MSDNFKAAFGAMQQASAASARASLVPPPPPAPATRQGQREIVAAILAAAVIASEGKPVSMAEAVERMAMVFEGMERHRTQGG